jgi:hypothetical protein
MTGPSRQGSSLLELVAALSGLLIVSSLVAQVIITQTRVALTQEARSGLGSGLRTGVTFLSAEWRDLTPAPAGSSGDLLSLGPDALTYRAPRATALACSGGQDQILLRADPWHGLRQLAPDRDSLLVLIEGDTATSSDDRWLPLPVFSVGSGACQGAPAMVVATRLDSAIVQGDVRFDAPVIAFEIMQVRSYMQASQTWLGARSVSGGEVIQPLLGPLDTSGLRLTYLDANGATTNLPGEVRVILSALSLVSDKSVHGHGAQGPRSPVRDSVVVRLTLRSGSGP